jgi:hypothetical protein
VVRVQARGHCADAGVLEQERALQKARVAWGDDDMDDDLEDIMASLKVCFVSHTLSLTLHRPSPLLTQAPDTLFAQPQFMSQMQRAYGSSFAVSAASAYPPPPPNAAAAPLPPLPRPSAAVAFHSAALAPALPAPAAAAPPHVGLLAPQTAVASRPPPPALVERNHNPPASAPARASSEDDLGTAWGITDPRTLAALKKREAKFKGKDAARRQKEVRVRRCGSRFFKARSRGMTPPRAGHVYRRRAPGVFQGSSRLRRADDVIGAVGTGPAAA